MNTGVRESSVLSRRTLMAAGAGWALGAAGLYLPESMNEAEAREGALGGAKGGRHGKNHRGRDKRRGDDDNEKRDKARDEGFGLKNVMLTFSNEAGRALKVKVVAWNNKEYPSEYVEPGSPKIYQSGGEWIKSGFSSGGSDVVHLEAWNAVIGEPYVIVKDDYGTYMDPYLSENEEFTFTEQSSGNQYLIKRGNDTEDYKTFYVTSIAVI